MEIPHPNTIRSTKTKSISVPLVNFFTILMMISVVMNLTGESSSSIYVVLLGVMGLSAIIVTQSNKYCRNMFNNILFVSLVIWIIMSFLVLYRNTQFYKPFAPTIFISVLSGFLMAFAIVYLPVKVRWLKNLYYIVAGFFYIMFVIRGMTLYLLFGMISGAGLGIVFMALLIPILYLEYRDSNKISLLPLLIQVTVFLFIPSRTTLVYGVLLLITSVFVIVREGTSSRFIRYLGYILMFTVFALVIYYVYSASSYGVISKFQDLGTDTQGRDEVWNLYFEDFSLHDVLFGRNIVVPFYQADSFQNAHNSFIQLHSLLGFSAFIIMIIWLWLIVRNIKRNIFYSLILTSLILLGAFNYVFFFKTSDCVLYIFFFDFLRNRHISPVKKRIKVSLV